MAERPKVGVGLFVLGDDGRFVVIRRRGSHGEGTWALVGGHVEFGQSPQEAAAQEALEEMGLVLDPAAIGVGPWTNDVFRDEGKHYVTFFAWARLPHGQWPRFLEDDKISDWRWATADDLPGPVFLPLRNLLDAGWRPPVPDVDARPFRLFVSGAGLGGGGYDPAGYDGHMDFKLAVARDAEEAASVCGERGFVEHPLDRPLQLLHVLDDGRHDG